MDAACAERMRADSVELVLLATRRCVGKAVGRVRSKGYMDPDDLMAGRVVRDLLLDSSDDEDWTYRNCARVNIANDLKHWVRDKLVYDITKPLQPHLAIILDACRRADPCLDLFLIAPRPPAGPELFAWALPFDDTVYQHFDSDEEW